MSPPTEVRPGVETGAASEAGQATGSSTTVTPATDRLPLLPDGQRGPLDLAPSDAPARSPGDTDDDAETVDRHGIRRVKLSRTSDGRCDDCGQFFRTLAGAASHGRAARHVVEGRNSVDYLSAPIAEDGAR